MSGGTAEGGAAGRGLPERQGDRCRPVGIGRGGHTGSAASAQASGPGDRPEAVYDFLAPARKPGELGRLGPYQVLKVLGAGGMGVVFQRTTPTWSGWLR